MSKTGFRMNAIKHDPMYRYLTVLTIASMLGFQTWQTLFNNFAVDVAGLQGFHVGIIQGIRELPGFLALLAIFLIRIIKEHKLSALSIFSLGLGLAVTGFFPSFFGLIFTTLLLSFGFHYYETTNQSLTLQYFDQNKSPWVFGKFRSYGAASNIAAGVIIFLSSTFLNFKQIYLFMGVAVCILAVWALLQNPARTDLVLQQKKMILRRKYWLYYVLTFLAGARRQIFTVFAVFLLVKHYGYTVQEITVLFIINNTVNFFLSPAIGRAIIRLGERKILTLEYSAIFFIFLAYAFIPSALIAGFLYILDHIFFNFSIAVRTYFQKIGDPRDIAPTMAVGFTINHLAAVVIPVFGGILWMVDYRIPFLAAAGLSMISLVMTRFMKTSFVPKVKTSDPSI